jgi:hypothetical protein
MTQAWTRIPWRAAAVALIFVFGAAAAAQSRGISRVSGDGPHGIAAAKPSVWTVVPIPNTPKGRHTLLFSVSGDADNDVWAVGSSSYYEYKGKLYPKALIEHWNGTAWSIVKAANEFGSVLQGVAAIAPDDAWAVGSTYAPGGASQVLTQHWDGKKWRVVPGPTYPNGAELLSVSAVSKKNVWASGDANLEALLEQWDGSSWQFVPGSTFNRELTVLNSIVAPDANHVMAVGEYWNPNPLAFTEYGTGPSSWSYEAPAGTGVQNQFNGVGAPGPNNIWAVGYEIPSIGGSLQTLIDHWTLEAGWSLVPSPNASTYDNDLYGVAARSANDIWAVGYYAGAVTNVSLFEHWNGKAWKVEPTPSALAPGGGTDYNGLFAVTRLPSGTLWAVGDQGIPGVCCGAPLAVEAPHT